MAIYKETNEKHDLIYVQLLVQEHEDFGTTVEKVTDLGVQYDELVHRDRKGTLTRSPTRRNRGWHAARIDIIDLISYQRFKIRMKIIIGLVKLFDILILGLLPSTSQDASFLKACLLTLCEMLVYLFRVGGYNI